MLYWDDNRGWDSRGWKSDNFHGSYLHGANYNRRFLSNKALFNVVMLNQRSGVYSDEQDPITILIGSISFFLFEVHLYTF